MADENATNKKNQLDELHAWIANISLPKQAKNLSRDFADAVMMAEIIKIYYPRYVDLHNYVPANNLLSKKKNWEMLNRRVLCKIDMKLTKDDIHQLANSNPGTVEQILLELKRKVLKDSEYSPNDCRIDDKADESVDEEKLGENDVADDTLNKEMECPDEEETLTSVSDKKSIFLNALTRFLYLLKWLVSWLFIWTYFSNLLTRTRNDFRNPTIQESEETDTQNRAESMNEDGAVPHHVYVELKEELRKMDNVIGTLNHKVTYLETMMKLKEEQITTLSSRVPWNNKR